MNAQVFSKNVRLPPLITIRDIIKLYRLRALKQLSQNFLLDERITDKIVKEAGNLNNNYVCEVGPGPGSITRSIIKKIPKKLIVVEKDPRFLPNLELLKEASASIGVDMKIDIGDIMSYNLESAFDGVEKQKWYDESPPIHLIGNLPFSISTYLLITWLKSISEQKSAWSYGRTQMTLTFQKEIAERIVAPILSKQRCRLSVMCQIWCNVRHSFTISGKAFLPKPKVDVGIVKITPKKLPLIENVPFKIVEKFLRTLFNMRQKYIKRGANNLFPEEYRDELVTKLFDTADIDPTCRSFQITNEEYCRLIGVYYDLIKQYPEIEMYDFKIKK